MGPLPGSSPAAASQGPEASEPASRGPVGSAGPGPACRLCLQPEAGEAPGLPRPGLTLGAEPRGVADPHPPGLSPAPCVLGGGPGWRQLPVQLRAAARRASWRPAKPGTRGQQHAAARSPGRRRAVRGPPLEGSARGSGRIPRHLNTLPSNLLQRWSRWVTFRGNLSSSKTFPWAAFSVSFCPLVVLSRDRPEPSADRSVLEGRPAWAPQGWPVWVRGSEGGLSLPPSGVSGSSGGWTCRPPAWS